jgi:hypothetical protein
VILSVSRKGDNAAAESFFATIKRELINDRAWPTRAGLHRAVFDYIEGWYNTRRLHSALGYFQPRRIRVNPLQRQPAGGMINSRNLSAKADQAHWMSSSPWNGQTCRETVMIECLRYRQRPHCGRWPGASVRTLPVMPWPGCKSVLCRAGPVTVPMMENLGRRDESGSEGALISLAPAGRLRR